MNYLGAVSLGSWDSVGKSIFTNVDSINEMFRGIFGFLTDKKMYGNLMAAVPDNVKSAVGATAISLCTLLFLMNFLSKTFNLQWVTWENVLMLILQLTITKVCVQNSEWIMDATQSAFASMASNVGDYEFIDAYAKDGSGNFIYEKKHVPKFLAKDPNDPYTFVPTYKMRTISGSVRKGTSFLWFGDNMKDYVNYPVPECYFYFLDDQDALCAYVAVNEDKAKAKASDLSPLLAWISVFVQSFLMKAILVVVLVIALSRYMHLVVYSVAAPLSLATFASDETKEIGKGFIKSYVACCVHTTVLIIIFAAYAALNTALTNYEGFAYLGGFMGLIKTFAFGGMVMKSESLSNKICGAM